MRSNAIPPAVPGEFEDLLNRNGRKVLAGTHPLCGALADPRTRFLAADDLFDRAKAARLRAVLEQRLTGTLVPLVQPIPPESIFDIKYNYSEQLPKTSRAQTVFFDSRRERGVKMAERIGLARLMRSESFHAFAQALAGRKLASGWGLQVLRYGPGDYAGPHNDHHPENERAARGYIDLHLSLCTPGVAHQWLVYSRAGHFSEIVSLAAPVTLTAYRLPFWHYTTPLVGKPAAARWVLLGTFLFSRIPQLNLPSDPAGRGASRQ